MARTIALTIRPDYMEDRPCSMLVMFGPPNAPPLESRWVFEWNLFCSERHQPGDAKKFCEYEPIGRTNRALLWYAGRPFDKYKNCLRLAKIKFAPELEPLSIVFRVDPKDADPNALVWARKRTGQGHFRMVREHFYHLNVTFANGGTVHQYVNQLGWRFTLFLLARRGQEITMTRLFTQFSTAWVNGNEPAPDGAELHLAEVGRNLDKLLPPHPRSRPAVIKTETEGKTMSMVIAAVPAMLTQTATDHFTPIPSNPSAHQMAALLQHIGVTNPPRIQPQGPARPRKAVKDCTWKADVLVLLAGKAAEYDPPISPDIKLPFAMDATPVEKLAVFKMGDGSLEATMNDVERTVRQISGDRNSPIHDKSKVMMNCFSAVSQLPGWQHVQDYIIDPAGYIDRSQELPSQKLMPRLIRDDNIAPLQAQGKQLLTQLVTRVAWLLQLRDASGVEKQPDVDARAIVFYLATDRRWIADAQTFMKEAELRVTQMLTRNPTRFAQFRELQKKGVAWPHMPAVRQAAQQAGFSFRPMMIKRDRMVCDTCLVEVSGIRPWHDFWNMHDYGRHPSSFRRSS